VEPAVVDPREVELRDGVDGRQRLAVPIEVALDEEQGVLDVAIRDGLPRQQFLPSDRVGVGDERLHRVARLRGLVDRRVEVAHPFDRGRRSARKYK